MENLIVRYYRGNYTREDLEKVKELFGREESDAQLSGIMQMQWGLTDNVEIGDKERFDSVLRQIHQSIDLEEKKESAFRRFMIGFSKAAAVMIIPICVALFVWMQHKQSGNRLEAQNTVVAPRGEIKQLMLPDGTKVWLNSGSKLSYSASFNSKIRKVSLSGEAYFEVTKNPEHPFVVRGNELSVRVLGTKFDVRSYREDARVDVTLMEGSVRLTDSQQNQSDLCLLKPNQQAMFNKKYGSLLIRTVDARNANEWTKGNLMFDDEELEQIARCLEREYGVSIAFQDDEIKHLRFFGKFKKKQPIDQILNIVVSRQNFHYTRKEKTIVFINNQ
jgi:transmembrane sensor